MEDVHAVIKEDLRGEIRVSSVLFCPAVPAKSNKLNIFILYVFNFMVINKMSYMQGL